MSNLALLPQEMKWLVDGFVFVVGACIGSFLNVCIHRLPREESIVSPGSHCGSCDAPIHWFDNIPLVSYFALGGQCRICGAKFSARYVVVEALTAGLFLWVWLKFGWDNPPLAVAYAIFAAGCVVAAFVDLEHYLIPDAISIGGMVIGFFYSLFCHGLHLSTSLATGAAESALGILVGSGVTLWVGILGEMVFQKEAMGFGDVKLMGAVGAFWGWQATLFAFGVGCIVGAVVGLGMWIWRTTSDRNALSQRYLDDAEILYITSGGQENRSIPFGPFLILGSLAWALGPLAWHSWVMGLLGTLYCWPNAFPCQAL